MFDLHYLQNVLAYWQIELPQTLPHPCLQGSPERCLHRWVVMDAYESRFILEQLDASSFERKTCIAQRIDRLAAGGIAATPYRRGINGQWIQQIDGYCWQLSPYIEGIALDREHYWDDPWREKASARILVQIAKETANWTKDEPSFDLIGYIDDLMGRVQRHNPEWMPKAAPIYEFVRRHLHPVIDEVPLGFCHGDPHPLNIIWGDNQIKSLIDWEFCGWKPALYDIALIVGCVGAESPEARNARFLSTFLSTIEQAHILSKETMALLPLFVLAVRFGWLSEWLRKKDIEMIQFELFYMRLIMGG